MLFSRGELIACLLFVVFRLQDTIPLTSFQQRSRPSRFGSTMSPSHRLNQILVSLVSHSEESTQTNLIHGIHYRLRNNRLYKHHEASLEFTKKNFMLSCLDRLSYAGPQHVLFKFFISIFSSPSIKLTEQH